MRLIDADELLQDNTWTWFDEWGNKTPVGEIIANAPTIDAVEVVRCKDCKWYGEEFIKGTLRQVPFCHKYNKFIRGDASWFCNGGKQDGRSQ